MSYPKSYVEAAISKGQSYFDYQSYEIPLDTNIERYEIIGTLGKGKYSEVFKCYDNLQEKQTALKILKPIRDAKIRREIKILYELKGSQNICELNSVIRDPCSKRYCLNMEHFESGNTMSQVLKLSEPQLRKFMYEVLKALDISHSKGIIHRDIKPQNILFSKTKGQLNVQVIDWGLAEYFLPGKQYNTRVASRYYKAPELFLNNKYYDYSLDMWSFGLIFAAAIFRTEVFIRGGNIEEQFRKIMDLIGTADVERYIHKYKLKPEKSFMRILREKIRQKTKLADLVTQQNWEYANDEALDLLQKLLVVEHTQRLPVNEALKHMYFDDLQ